MTPPVPGQPHALAQEEPYHIPPPVIERIVQTAAGMRDICAMLDQDFGDCGGPMFRRVVERGFIATRVPVPNGAVRRRAVLKQECSQCEILGAYRYLEWIGMAEFLAGRVVFGKD